MSHTPGPWFAHDFSGVNGEDVTPCDFAVSCTTPDHLTVATMGIGVTGTREEWEANAKLISAAPDLLEACELALESDDRAVKNVLRLAIAKARGET